MTQATQRNWVAEYDPAIRFFVDVLGFTLAEDSPSLTNDGRPKRWVVVRPPDAETGIPPSVLSCTVNPNGSPKFPLH